MYDSENYDKRLRRAEATYNGQFYTKAAKKDAKADLNET